MKKIMLIFTIFFISSSVFGLVDMKNGNYSKSFVDFEVKGNTFPLKMERTYNSRSLYRGLFGMGWCSNLETRVDVLPDGIPKLTVCGGGMEIHYSSKKDKPNIPYQVSEIIKIVKIQNKNLSKKYFQDLEKKLFRSNVLRTEFLRAYKVKGKIKGNQKYFAEGRKNDFLQYNTQGFFKRSMPNSFHQFFRASDGRLVQISDRAGNYVKIVWKKNRPDYIMDNKGRKIEFKYRSDRITVNGLSKRYANYILKDGNLAKVSADGNLYIYEYDELHNLISTKSKSIGSNETQNESLTYNIKKDWVTTYKNPRNCIEKYRYETNPQNQNHYWTSVVKRCGKVVTNKSRYEFWNRKNQKGETYLHRARQDINNNIKDIVYDDQFKRAIRITQNNVTTKYVYYQKGAFRGLLKEKAIKNFKVSYKSYHPTCRKANKVVLSKSSTKKRDNTNSQTVNLVFNNNNCLTKSVKRSDGMWVRLAHDKDGRISSMKNQAGKHITISYDPVLNIPQRIEQVGVGEVSFKLDRKTGKSIGFAKNSNPVIMSQVMQVFNGFLEIVAPVTSEVSI